jgi:hypothetical protein
MALEANGIVSKGHGMFGYPFDIESVDRLESPSPIYKFHTDHNSHLFQLQREPDGYIEGL